MKKKRLQTQEDLLDNLAKNVLWITANRNEGKIVDILLKDKSMDNIFGLDEAVIFDYLFNFMSELELLDNIATLKPEKSSIKRNSLDYFQYVILYIMKSVAGIKGMNPCQDLLFTDEFAMRLANFNGRQVENGINKRGLHRGERGVGEIRGVINNDTLANNIEKIDLRLLRNKYNKTIKILAKNKYFPKNVDLILDCTEIETTENFPGCGKVKKEKPVWKKGTHKEKKLIDVYGFKLWAVYVASVDIPVAVWFDKIQVHDTQHAKRVIKDAIKNLDGCNLRSISFDRGFIDGSLLYYVDKKTPIKHFVIPSKSNMNVTKEAIFMGQTNEHCEKEVLINRGHGKNAFKEKKLIKLQYAYEIDVEWFNKDGSEDSHCNKKEGEYNRLNAVIIEKDETYKRNDNDGEDLIVFLTNMEVNKPFKVYNLYDERSLIENCLNRQLKQAWYLENPPKRTIKAMEVHIYFIMMCFSITSAFKNYQEKQWKKICKNEDCAMERYRRKLKATNKDNLVIFTDETYGIFKSYEPFMLCDVNVKGPEKKGITKDSIIKKYQPTPPD